jgi:hypothetical protein
MFYYWAGLWCRWVISLSYFFFPSFFLKFLFVLHNLLILGNQVIANKLNLYSCLKPKYR